MATGNKSAQPDPAREFPDAVVHGKGTASSGSWLGTKLWIVTAGCLVLAVGLSISSGTGSGPVIVVHFGQGHGIQPGNTLQHRGIEVGEVTSVTLNDDAGGVTVNVELQPQAASLAREGSQFWIVRPELSLSRMAGLETVVGAKYIGVQPGPEGGEPQLEFDGLAAPLSLIDSNAVEVTVHFAEGFGLVVGDQVRHRGIVIGEVTRVDLSDDLSGVSVGLRLIESARRLARAGTRFWIERPAVTAAEIRGLETLVGGRYVAVAPGPSKAEPQSDFDGLNQPPPDELPEGGLEITLWSPQRTGLSRGVPVMYRGLKVGHVISSTLASDAASVEARAWINARYRHLVREKTEFWNTSGVKVSGDLLHGIELTTDSLSNVLVGGISMATPDPPGKIVSTGARFRCWSDEKPEWLTWNPHLPLGTESGEAARPLPVPLRASLRWKKSVLGIRRKRQTSGWVIPLSNGKLLGPADLLSVVEEARDGQVLEVGGKQIAVKAEKSAGLGPFLAVLTPGEPVAEAGKLWPVAAVAHPKKLTDCQIVTTGFESSISLAVSRLTPQQDRWLIDPSIALTQDHYGAAVVSRTDGRLIGIVSVSKEASHVVLIPASAKQSGS